MKPKYRITIVPDGVLTDGYFYVVTHWKNDKMAKSERKKLIKT